MKRWIKAVWDSISITPIVAATAFSLAVLSPLAFNGQEKKPPSPPPTEAGKAPAANAQAPPPNHAIVPLTDAEKVEWDNNQLRIENLNLRINQLQDQISKEQLRLAQEASVLTTKFAKAHNVDPAKYRLDSALNAFVPSPPTPKK